MNVASAPPALRRARARWYSKRHSITPTDRALQRHEEDAARSRSRQSRCQEGLCPYLAVQAATCQEQQVRTILSLRVDDQRLEAQREFTSTGNIDEIRPPDWSGAIPSFAAHSLSFSRADSPETSAVHRHSIHGPQVRPDARGRRESCRVCSHSAGVLRDMAIAGEGGQMTTATVSYSEELVWIESEDELELAGCTARRTGSTVRRTSRSGASWPRLDTCS
jgi:hypothetical protein